MKAITLLAVLVVTLSCTSEQMGQFAEKQKQASEYCGKAKAALDLVKKNKGEVCGPIMALSDLTPQLAKAKEACSDETSIKDADAAVTSACAVVDLLKLP